MAEGASPEVDWGGRPQQGPAGQGGSAQVGAEAQSGKPSAEGAGENELPGLEHGLHVDIRDARYEREGAWERQTWTERNAQCLERRAQAAREAGCRSPQIRLGRASTTCRVCHLTDCSHRRGSQAERTTHWDDVLWSK